MTPRPPLPLRRLTQLLALAAALTACGGGAPGDPSPASPNPPAPTTGTQGQLYAYQATATDANAGDTQAWSLDAGPAGMTISSAGLVAWTPTNAQAITNGGQSSATIRVTDSGGLFATQTFTVTVANVNDPPAAANDGPYPWVEGGTLTRAAPGVLANDTDPDGDPLAAVSYLASIGTLSGNASGSFSWFLPMGSAGQRTFTYQARDPGLATSTATVTVNVQALAANAFVWTGAASTKALVSGSSRAHPPSAKFGALGR